MQGFFCYKTSFVQSLFRLAVAWGGLCILGSCRNELVNTSYATLNQKSINGIDALCGLLKHRAHNYLETSYLTRRVRKEADLVVFVEKSAVLYPSDFFAQFESWLTGRKPTEEKKKTFLYFVEDTTTDLPFFERVYHDLQGFARQQNHILRFLKESQELREMAVFTGELPFGERFLSRPGGPLLPSSVLVWSPRVFAKKVHYFPVRMLSTPPVLNHVQGAPLRFQSLLSTTRGEVLIREFFFPKIRFIIVYNTEAFLNYSLVRKPYQRLTASLLDYALPKKSKEQKGAITISFIQRLPIPPSKAKGEEDKGFLRIFFVYPLNLLLFSFGMLLLSFLLNRWPHKRRPLPAHKRGSRIFLEHFRALGLHLSRSKDREEVLESLLAFKKARISHVSQKPLPTSSAKESRDIFKTHRGKEQEKEEKMENKSK